jgi:RNA polymerase sigma factor (sigma-70 family)
MAATSVVDNRAFERLYRRYGRDVYRFALSLVRNPSEAEDVTQTTFMNAYRALQAGEQPRRPHSWLLTIAHNTARSRVRRAMRRPREVPLDDVGTYLAVPEHERTNIRELLRALRRLPFNQRTAITMREFEGKSYPEIADTLGVTVPAVEALLARARRTLRLHAAAIRGLSIVVGLPRSLRRLLESPEATTGGAMGAGLIAKAAAVVVAAGVVGGIGFWSSGASPPATPDAAQVVFPQADSAVPIAARPQSVDRTAAGPGVRAAPAPFGRAQVSHPLGSLPKPDSGGTAVLDSRQPPAAPQSSPSAPEQGPVRATVQQAGQSVASPVQTTRQAVSTATGAVPTVTLPVPTVPAPPSGTVPTLPPPPSGTVPTLPPPPSVTVPTLPAPPTVTVPTLPPPPLP